MILNLLRNIFKKISLPQILIDFYKVFEQNGFEAYLVGGAFVTFV